MARANQKLKASVARKRLRPESESEEFTEESESSEDELINDPDLPFEVVNPNGRTRVDMFGGILKAQQVDLWAKRKKTGCDSEENTEDEASWSDEDEMHNGYGEQASDEEPTNDENGKKVDVLEEAVGGIVEPIAMKWNPTSDKEEVLQSIQDTDDHSHNPSSQELANDLMKTVTEEERSPEAALPSYLSEEVEPLSLSEPINTITPGVTGRTLESTPDSSVKLLVARPECIDTDDEEIPQAPLIPLNIMTDKKPKSSVLKHSPFIDCLTEMSVKPSKITLGNKLQAGGNNSSQLVVPPKGKIVRMAILIVTHKITVASGGSPSTAKLLQTSSVSAVLDVHCNQNSLETPPSVPSSASNTAPTVQVEETPYRKSGLGMRNIQSPSPTISRARASLGYESDDITLIPATNTEELCNSSASVSFLAARTSTSERDSSPPEVRAISPGHTPSSAKIGNLEASFPNNFSTPQRQLRREMQQCTQIEVPATSETDGIKVQHARPQPPPSRRISKTRKLKRLIKSVDFQSQEIRAANAHNVSSQLEKQKKEFLSLEDGCDFEDLDFQMDCPPPTDEYPCKELGMDTPGSPGKTIGKRDLPAPVPASPVKSYVLISSGDEADSSKIPQSATRKRHQPAPLSVSKPAKKPRADDEFTYGTSHSSPLVLPTHHAAENIIKIPRDSRTSRTATVKSVEDEDEAEIEPEPDSDLMAGFPAIYLPTDYIPESSWSSQIPPRPEIYAGIRERHLDVPGYGNLTDGQKKELDKRRQEYFGITPREGTKRLFSVELQRAMQATPPSSSFKKRTKHTVVGELANTVANEWYRDENTPLKIFYRKFKDLKQVKAELESGTDRSRS